MKNGMITGFCLGLLLATSFCSYFIGKYLGELKSAEFRVIAAECYYTSRAQDKQLKNLLRVYKPLEHNLSDRKQLAVGGKR
jgi:hypothetical protein